MQAKQEQKDEEEGTPRKKARKAPLPKLEVVAQNLGTVGENWTVVELPAATKMWEPIDIHFRYIGRDGRSVDCHFECIDYGKCHITKSKGRTYKTEPRTNALFHQKLPASTGTMHVYLEAKEGNGRFYHCDRDRKLIVRREPFRYDYGDCGP